MKMKQRSFKNGSSNGDWATPDYILDDVKKEFGDFFDPCPYKHDLNNWDGLKVSWKAVNYINPPYDRLLKEAFILKAFEESKKGKVCIMLLPVSTDTKIFHEVILPNAEIKFIKGRVKFKGFNTKGEYVTNKAGQGGSMFVIFRGFKDVELSLSE